MLDKHVICFVYSMTRSMFSLIPNVPAACALVLPVLRLRRAGASVERVANS